VSAHASVPAARVGRRAAAAAGAGGLVLWTLVLLAVAVISGASYGPLFGAEDGTTSEGASALAQRDVPATYLALYQRAAQRYGIDWALLAAIGKVECDHGRDPLPACTREGATNSAGAGGPMQFIASTWAQYGVDGNGDGVADRWNAADAIYAAANYLHASGAPADSERAIFAYNHANWYVREVERWAALYRGSSQPVDAPTAPAEQWERGGASLTWRSPTPVLFVAGAQAVLAPGDGHLALVPAAAPPVVQAMVVAGNELQGLRYGAAGHPDPRGVEAEDCSSSVNYLLYRSGVRALSEILRDNPLAQDYVRWGSPGPGRWVSIYATAGPTPHVFIVVAGLRLDTSHDGTDEGPNREQDGPRWRVSQTIPTWAHWSVRHPPGL
jgi:Transglycosylase SLT domain